MKLLAAMQLLLPGMPFIYYGDEVGMTGGRDPDCRRGMLWDETRQDRDMLAYYRRLITIRKAYPALDGDEMTADDENGLVTIRRGNLIVLFHGRSGAVNLSHYAGKVDLLSDKPFSGVLGDYEAAVLKM